MPCPLEEQCQRHGTSEVSSESLLLIASDAVSLTNYELKGALMRRLGQGHERERRVLQVRQCSIALKPALGHSVAEGTRNA